MTLPFSSPHGLARETYTPSSWATPLARGLTNYDSREVDAIRGRRNYDEVIHRDNLVMIGDEDRK